MPAESTSVSKRISNGFQEIFFSVDAALLRELGERLVGKPQIALSELVKNSYDADATVCRVTFEENAIEVVDNGNGMTETEFKKFWMRIGTTHKQRASLSRLLARPVTGSKGIGRLAVQFLGNQLELWSVPSDTPSVAVHARVDWSEAREREDMYRAGALFRTERSEGILPSDFPHGTRIRISELNQVWGREALQGLARELWFLQPPRRVKESIPQSMQFAVQMTGLGSEEFQAYKTVTGAMTSNWVAELRGQLKNGRADGKCKVTLKFAEDDKRFVEYVSPKHRKLDEARFRIGVFKLTGRQPAGIPVDTARDYFKRFGGVHIYDADFRLPFYGGNEQDWLGLEIDHSHRLSKSRLLPPELQIAGGMNDLPTLSRLFGIVQISTAHERDSAPLSDAKRGEYLNIQITRDRLIDNAAFEDLIYIVRWALDFYANRSYERRQKQAATQVRAIPDPDIALERVEAAVSRLEDKAPRKLVEDLRESIRSFEDVERTRREVLENERVLLGALATAGMGALALEHELAKEITLLRNQIGKLRKIAKNSDTSPLSDVAEGLQRWVDRASEAKLLFSPLMNETDRGRKTTLIVRRVVEATVRNLRPLLRNVEVQLEDVPKELRFPPATMAAWNAILQNVFLNAVNATLESSVRKVRCRTETKRGWDTLLVEDTGVGVDLVTSERLFDPFVRQLKISEERRALGLGGVGLGLTIVRMIAETVGCTTGFVRPRSPFKTAFALSWRVPE